MSLQLNEVSFAELVEQGPQRLIITLRPYLAQTHFAPLHNAMEYTFNNGGKRIRPLLVYATGKIFTKDWQCLDHAALAVELIHTYSLIHDDLPSMDNADLRRGKPTCHKAFNEALAILAGDALLTLAFQIIAESPKVSPARVRELVIALARASGPAGMVAGQALDTSLLQDETLSLEELTNIIRLKTGALLSVSVLLGWLASGDTEERNKEALVAFGNYLGEAFQLQDDIFDITKDTAITGKPQHIDVQNAKKTIPERIGIEKAQAQLTNLYNKALKSIDYLGNRAQLLRELTDFLINRKQ